MRRIKSGVLIFFLPTGILAQESAGPVAWGERIRESAAVAGSAIEEQQRGDRARVAARNLELEREERRAIDRLLDGHALLVDSAEKAMGENHPVALDARGGLASLFRSHQRWEAAATQQRRIFTVLTRKLGADHPDTIKAMETLANDASLMGDRLETVRLRETVYLKRKKTLGPDHASTLAARSEYCIALMRAKMYRSGEKEFRELIAQELRLRPDTFYPEHHRKGLENYLRQRDEQTR